MRLAITVFLLLFLCPMGAGLGQESTRLRASIQGETGQAQTGGNKPLTNADIVSMVKAGMAESTIVLAIQHSSTVFDTSPQALISLQSQGVPPCSSECHAYSGERKTNFARRAYCR